MGLFEQLPYTNFSNLNLCELIKTVKELSVKFDEFKALNTITYEGVWNITKNYKTWSVVSAENGDGYISLQPVPSGIAITNTTYWSRLYDFLSEVGILSQRVSALETTSASHTASINSLNTSVGNLNRSVNNLNADMPKKLYKSWNDRKVLFIGDSYLDGWNGTASVKDYSGYMNDLLHFSAYYKQSQGGAGFSTGAGVHFITLAQQFVSGHTTAVCNSITDIFILAGYNDLSATQEDIIENASYGIATTVAYLKNNFPNASITIGVIARALYTNAMTFARFKNVVNSYKIGALFNDVHYLENCELILHDYTLFNNGYDRIHPSNEGYRQLGRMLAILVNNGDFSYIYETSAFGTINMDYTDSSFNSNPFRCYQGITRNAVTIDCYGGQCHLNSPIASWELYSSRRILVGDFHGADTPNYFMPMYDVMIPIPMSIKHAGGVTNVDGAFILGSDGKMYICAQHVNDSSWSYPTLTNVTDIHFGVASYAIPIEYC